MKNPLSKAFNRLSKINWLNYFLEFIIVFLGITIAFYINQRAENHKSLEQEQTYLQMLVADLQTDSVDHSYIINFYEGRLTKLESAFILLEEAKEENIDSIIYLSLVIAQTSNYHPDVKTYQSLVQNGEILKLSDLELRQELAKYHAYYGTLEDRHGEVKESKRSKLAFFLNQHYDFWSGSVVHRDAFLSLELKNILFEVRQYELNRIRAYKKALYNSLQLKEKLELDLK